MLTIEQEIMAGDTLIFHLQGELTIETVEDLRQALQEAMGQPVSRLQLDAARLAAIDFFGLQLLCSAHRTTIANNKHLSWLDNRPPQFDDARNLNGFHRHCGCTLCPPGVDCMWI